MASPIPRLQLDETLRQMQQGTTMRKVKSKSWKKPRYFKLQDDCMTVWHQSSCTCEAKYTFSLSEVEAVREGHQSEVLQGLAEEFPPECCFTVVFHGRRGHLDLVAGSPQEAQCWVRGLRRLLDFVTSMDQQEKTDQWIRDWFQKADKNRDGRMSFPEARQLLRLMNIDMNEDHARRIFQEADRSESETLEDEEFVLFYTALTQRGEVLRIFQEFSEAGKKLTLLEFADFLQQEQQEPENSKELAMQLIDRYEPSETAKVRHMLTIDGFLLYLLSPDGDIFDPAHESLCQDMTQPLCHYFISSSHNTYLLADQLQGQSSIEGYIRALKRGCRCVEVDCWDGRGGEPVVCHGHTLTSQISFQDVVAALGQYAFQASDYPVILSLENHCGPEQQHALAQHLTGILGERLLTAPLEGWDPARLPSPEALRGKILLKGKRAESPAHSLSGQPDEATEGDVLEEEEEEGLEAEGERQSHEAKVNALSDWVVYCRSVPFRSFRQARACRQPYEMASLSEPRARKLIKEAGNEFVCHNARQLTRIYPRGLRADSSNYDPQEMWNVGCQLVALNVQTAGAEMDLSDGLFRQNGRCGYVLKPAFLRDEGTTFDPADSRSWAGGGPWSLEIQVISGQQLPKAANSTARSIMDPLVRVEIHGVPADQAKEETKYVSNNGFNPSWEETLQFTVRVPELALVRFVVEDYDRMSRNDFMGQFTLPFTSIRAGYRHIHLLSRDGTAMPPSSLFVHIKITELPEPE
ncbi:1-phosphatidylinositol 4,5-bisphosphate phosphodiesterase delta-4 isoform X2 [Pelodiscus sinensis]|uniref:1-phosphatidylinositol 4,5-bisphosphate phosphodiesterase delta-4 isoform X2 n=1 Tax=Pelodiscus sinensis TaxID=13735 RepID=UPI003F6C3D00